METCASKKVKRAHTPVEVSNVAVEQLLIQPTETVHCDAARRATSGDEQLLAVALAIGTSGSTSSSSWKLRRAARRARERRWYDAPARERKGSSCAHEEPPHAAHEKPRARGKDLLARARRARKPLGAARGKSWRARQAPLARAPGGGPPRVSSAKRLSIPSYGTVGNS